MPGEFDEGDELWEEFELMEKVGGEDRGRRSRAAPTTVPEEEGEGVVEAGEAEADE
jgi:hypothetical protein